MTGATAQDATQALRALCRAGRFAEAVRLGARLLDAHPDVFALCSLVGAAALQAGETDVADRALSRAVALDPRHAGARYNLGLLHQRTGRRAEAISAYEAALECDRNHAGALTNLGNLLSSLGRHAEAEAAYRRALSVRPEDADLLSNLGATLREQDRPEAALEAWGRVLEGAPNHAAARAQTLRLRWQRCDFSAHAEFGGLADTLGVTGDRAPPFIFLPAEDAPERQRRRADLWARDLLRTAPERPAPRHAEQPDRLRVGYVSACFHDHPTARLIAGLMRTHDRARFETVIYSHGRDTTGALRHDIKACVDRFHDLKDLAPLQIARRIADDGIDIAIDLDGYTRGMNAEIFSRRPAPLSVGFLGYPGTLGQGLLDYLVADRIVVPPQERAHYSESLIFLPGSYQSNDDRRAPAEGTDTRAGHDLPEGAFVFCCFNNAAKIGPREFDIWMRLLSAVPGSVLWLMHAGAEADRNLRREAALRGVDPARLILAPQRPQAEHVARYRHADLFLDTFAYNAHTTGSDALWAGLPVVTRAGRQFAARVGASLLTAAGLPDLVVRTDAEYEALGLALARDPARLARLRARVEAGRRDGTLFDTERFTRAFEDALDGIFARCLAGKDPRDIEVTPRV